MEAQKADAEIVRMPGNRGPILAARLSRLSRESHLRIENQLKEVGLNGYVSPDHRINVRDETGRGKHTRIGLEKFIEKFGDPDDDGGRAA